LAIEEQNVARAAANLEGLPGIFLAYGKSIPQTAIYFQWMRSMIDAVLNVAVFAALALCIVGFSAWAHKRVP